MVPLLWTAVESYELFVPQSWVVCAQPCQSTLRVLLGKANDRLRSAFSRRFDPDHGNGSSLGEDAEGTVDTGTRDASP